LDIIFYQLNLVPFLNTHLPLIHVYSAPLDIFTGYFSRDFLNRIMYTFELEYTGILPETVQYEIWGSYSSAELYMDTVLCQLV